MSNDSHLPRKHFFKKSYTTTFDFSGSQMILTGDLNVFDGFEQSKAIKYLKGDMNGVSTPYPLEDTFRTGLILTLCLDFVIVTGSSNKSHGFIIPISFTTGLLKAIFTTFKKLSS